MYLPFTVEQFLAVFERYNLAISPMQLVAYALGLAAVALALRPGRYSGQIIVGILAFLWLWTGVIYHSLFFREINAAAAGFGVLFVAQAGPWVLAGVVRPRPSFRAGADLASIVGGLFVLYAMVVYPIVGAPLVHGYPHLPTFGLTPCPLTIFTFGLLLWSRTHVPRYGLAIPLVW